MQLRSRTVDLRCPAKATCPDPNVQNLPTGDPGAAWLTTVGATACIMIFILGAAMYRLQGSLSFATITVLSACGGKGSLG